MNDDAKSFVRWLNVLDAELEWKEGNRNPLEVLLDTPELDKALPELEAQGDL